MLQSFAYYVSILRKDFTEYCSNQLSGAGLSPGQLYFILYVGKHPGVCPGRTFTGAPHGRRAYQPVHK